MHVTCRIYIVLMPSAFTGFISVNPVGIVDAFYEELWFLVALPMQRIEGVFSSTLDHNYHVHRNELIHNWYSPRRRQGWTARKSRSRLVCRRLGRRRNYLFYTYDQHRAQW